MLGRGSNPAHGESDAEGCSAEVFADWGFVEDAF
jgi:hypothetical protein